MAAKAQENSRKTFIQAYRWDDSHVLGWQKIALEAKPQNKSLFA